MLHRHPGKSNQQQEPLYFRDPFPEGRSPVLLIHGLGVTGDSWQLQLPALIGAGYRPVAPDVPGFGRSASACKRWSVARSAEALWELADQLSIDRVHLVGISMGGALALQMAVQASDRVQTLTLINTFDRIRPDNWREWFYFARRYWILVRKGVTEQASYVATQLFPDPNQELLRQALLEQVLQTDRAIYLSAMRALGLFDISRRLSQIRVPTLVVTGERDTTIPPRLQRRLAGRIPGAVQVLIQGGGHAVTVDQAARFNQVLLDFLGSPHLQPDLRDHSAPTQAQPGS